MVLFTVITPSLAEKMIIFIRNYPPANMLKIISIGLCYVLLLLIQVVPALGQAEEDVTFNIQGTDDRCPTSLEGYWVKNGDIVDAMEVGEQGVNLLYRSAVIARIPLFSELPRTAPCVYPVTLRVLASESANLKAAVSSKRRITLVMSAKGSN